MPFSPLLSQLIESLMILPGVGRKSAQRMALSLLERDRDASLGLAQAIDKAISLIGRCQRCRNLTESDVCQVCNDHSRDAQLICIVETPMDVIAIESAGGFRGQYFVLYGRLSPLDGIGPEQLALDMLEQRVVDDAVKEVILATNLTVEGEATAHYISERLRAHGVEMSRIAQGVPTGGELEYVDANTLSLALAGRKTYG